MRQILVVEDDADLRRMLARVLSAKYFVTTAGNGREALARIRGGRRYDLILSDLAMPQLDGAQLYWQLIEIAPAQARRMVFMSGGERPIAAQRLLRVVDNAYLAKPFEADHVRALLAQLLELWGPVAAFAP